MQAVDVFKDMYNRNKLMKRLDSLAKVVHDDLGTATSRIRDHVPGKLEQMGELQPFSGAWMCDCRYCRGLCMHELIIP